MDEPLPPTSTQLEEWSAEERQALFQSWVDQLGRAEASRRWLALWAATDAPITG